MTYTELARRAEAAGISLTYENFRHEIVTVSDETLEALLAALEAVPAHAPATAPETTAPAPDPSARPVFPGRRYWGFAIQLYSVRSRDSWGHGDLHDLAELASWSASDLGAGFILINPLHAAEPLPPVSPSPYLPMTRRYTSPLYLRIEDIPEYRQLSARQQARIGQLAAGLRARNSTPDLIHRDAVWTAKREALEMIYQVPLADDRRAALERFRAGEGQELRAWASWCALAEQHGPDWREWPDELQDARFGMAQAAAGKTADFHAWLQWLAAEQLAAAQQAAKDAGMAHGIIHDLAVGVHPGGADAWAHQDLLVRGVSVGAPPDGFNQLGQDWAQPPWNPQRLAEAGYRPLAELFAGALRHAGGLRVDHVLGLMRLWWIPEGMPPECGASVHYDFEASVGALAGAAAAAGAVGIGEDLGTMDPDFGRHLAEHAILGTMMLWFALEPDGSPMRPGHWRHGCMATVGTHDVPPAASYLAGDQVTVRARLGLLNQPEQAERASAERELEQWQQALVREGLLEEGPRPDPAAFTLALYGYLARTPAVLLGVSLADAVGETRTQNVPGTSTQYPNWQIPLCDGAGEPVLLDDLPHRPLVRAIAEAVSAIRPVSQEPADAGRAE